MKLKDKKEVAIIIAIVIIQTIAFIIAGANKSYIHMDETYSLGLANYDKVEIQANNDFYNQWHSKEYYEDYLAVQNKDIGKYSQVYENQKNDVHPPLYYLLLRFAMGFHIGSYSKWTGITLNIIIYAFIIIFVYLIIKKLLEGEEKYKEKSAILALVSSLTLASINNVIYIRMYALATLNIVITTYLHLKLLDTKGINYKLLTAIGISALVGSLTHYYYLFYLAILFIMFVIKYIKEKDYKSLLKYIVTMLLAGVISLIIFPYSIQHMFFGYRGQGAINNLTNISKFLSNICLYLLKINVYAFNNVLIIILGIIIYTKLKKVKIEKNRYVKYITVPTIIYTILVAIASPWIELRYIMPVCGLIFILVLYLTYMLLKGRNKIIIGIFLLMIIMPIITNNVIDLVVGQDFKKEKETSYSSKTEMAEKLKSEFNLPIDMVQKFSNASIEDILLFIKDFKVEPEVLYSNKQDIVEFVSNNNNLPTLYLFNSNNNRFLDDILLLSNIKESYIAKDIECNEENIKEIMQNKNISNGMLIFINDGQNNNELLEKIKNTLQLKNTTYLKRLNACDVYLIK